jgi:hypothetical protein
LESSAASPKIEARDPHPSSGVSQKNTQKETGMHRMSPRGVKRPNSALIPAISSTDFTISNR